MSKKLSFLLLFLAVLPTLLFPASAQEKKEKEKAITLVGKVVPQTDENSNMVFAGVVKNNSQDLLAAVEIVFEIIDGEGLILESTSALIDPLSSKIKGILHGGEAGFFEVTTHTSMSLVRSYKYNITWKTFGKGKPITSESAEIKKGKSKAETSEQPGDELQ